MFDGSFAMYFHSLNYPSYTCNQANTQKIAYKVRWNPILAIPPSSTLFHTDKNERYSESEEVSGPLLSQANTVGIIGGVSAKSTLSFMEKLLQWSSKDGQDCLPFIICSDPVLSKELSEHERTQFPYSSRQIERSRLDHTRIVENLRSKRCYLEKSGAHCIVIPCDISHSWYDEISTGCSVTFLHMSECVARELKEAKLKPLEAGSPPRIGVLGTDATLAAGFYQEKLHNEGLEVVLPDKATVEHTVLPAIGALNRKDMEGARNLLRIALQVLLVRAVNTVILASDEMRNLLPKDDPLLKKCIDPMDALVRSTIRWAQTVEQAT
ncbi:hypothetical protein K2173_024266 [Erythroxylum novogranatense]|uniref:Aspartate racemase n=1 Tax=Erythroxylum novogranatense TaxID=1862640 RepID=A0AAV8STT1_9ROSI|nr:hypothetical protein K2173_024266 [Erythroxylum novogranatense]